MTTTVTQLRSAAHFAGGLYKERWDRWYAARFRGDQLARLSLREGRRDPYAVYEAMRAIGPMVPTRLGNWATTSYAICNQVLRSRQFGVREETGASPVRSPQEEFDLSFLSLNEPDHARLRRVAAPAFSPKMMAGYATTIDQTVGDLLDAAEAKGTFDLVADLAAPLPIAVITRMMGVDGGDAAAFQRYGAALGSALDGVTSIGQARRVIEANRELDVLFARLFEEREREPRDDLVSVIVAEKGDRIRPEELRPMCSLLLIAGFETTVNLIGNAVRALLAHPEQWEMLRADPVAGPRGDRGGAAVGPAGPGDRPAVVPGRPRSAACRCTSTRPWCSCWPGRTATRSTSSTPPGSTSRARRAPSTCRSPAASTTAWARRWPGSRRRSPSRR